MEKIQKDGGKREARRVGHILARLHSPHHMYAHQNRWSLYINTNIHGMNSRVSLWHLKLEEEMDDKYYF